MNDTRMRKANLMFSFSGDGKMVRATLDDHTVITALIVGTVDDARKERLSQRLTALAVECLEAVPAGAVPGQSSDA